MLLLIFTFSKDVYAQGFLPSNPIPCEVSHVPNLNLGPLNIFTPFILRAFHYCPGENICKLRTFSCLAPSPTPTPASTLIPIPTPRTRITIPFPSPTPPPTGGPTPTPRIIIPITPTPRPFPTITPIPTPNPTPILETLTLHPPTVECRAGVFNEDGATVGLSWTLDTNPTSFSIRQNGNIVSRRIEGSERSYAIVRGGGIETLEYQIVALFGDSGRTLLSNEQTITIDCSDNSSRSSTTSSPTPSPSPSPTLTPSPTQAPVEGQYRVSFDPNFATLINTGDGGIFGSNPEKIIPITLTGGLGRKYVYIQFFENGNWAPTFPAEITLTDTSLRAVNTPAPTPRLIMENRTPGGAVIPLYQFGEPPATPTSSVPTVPELTGADAHLTAELNAIRGRMERGEVDDWYELQWNLNNTTTRTVEGAGAVSALQHWIYENKTRRQVGSGPYPGPDN